MRLFKAVITMVFCCSYLLIAQDYKEISIDEKIDIDEFKTSNVMVLGTTDVVNKSKSDAFKSTFDLSSLNEFIQSHFEVALQNEMSDIKIVEPEEKLLEHLTNSAKTGKAIDSDSDYLILVNYIFIRDRMVKERNSTGTNPTSQGGTSTFMASRNPVTRVTINFEIWNLAHAKMVLMAEAMGEKRIFQSESKALKDALTKAIDNAADYIKSIESSSQNLSKL